MLQIAGVKLELAPNPGETEDQIYVWVPEKKVLFAGDNFYRCMPNRYAIRGTPYRMFRRCGQVRIRIVVARRLNMGVESLPSRGERPMHICWSFGYQTGRDHTLFVPAEVEARLSGAWP